MDVEKSSGAKRKAEMTGEAPPAARSRRRGKCRNICLGVTAVILLITIVVLILGFTVLKPRRPVTTIDSVGVDRMSASVDLARMRVHLNLTLDVHLSLRNPNRVGFKYSPASAHLNYRGHLVGEVPLPAGQISSRQTLPMNLTLTLMADRLLSDSHLLSDVMADAIPLNTFVKVSGRVSLLSIFKFHVESSTSCDITISVSNRTISHQDCKYSTKL